LIAYATELNSDWRMKTRRMTVPFCRHLTVACDFFDWRRHAAVAVRSVRVNIEDDSINSAVLLPRESAGSPAFVRIVAAVSALPVKEWMSDSFGASARRDWGRAARQRALRSSSGRALN